MFLLTTSDADNSFAGQISIFFCVFFLRIRGWPSIGHLTTKSSGRLLRGLFILLDLRSLSEKELIHPAQKVNVSEQRTCPIPIRTILLFQLYSEDAAGPSRAAAQPVAQSAPPNWCARLLSCLVAAGMYRGEISNGTHHALILKFHTFRAYRMKTDPCRIKKNTPKFLCVFFTTTKNILSFVEMSFQLFASAFSLSPLNISPEHQYTGVFFSSISPTSTNYHHIIK